MKNLLCSIVIFTSFSLFSQIEKVEPPNWWVGFENTSLQLLIKSNNISNYSVSIEYPGVSIKAVNKGNSPNYLFIDINIDPSTNPGTFEIVFKPNGKGKKIKYEYQLKKRNKDSKEYIGFNSSDVIYLITPDRFANGNPSNDIVVGLNEQSLNRSEDYQRHGGDIQGITKQLDYINDMGFTAIWSCPLLTNDMHSQSYHGYAITDLYEIDPRFGTLNDYLELTKKAGDLGVKIIMDQVANHCGLEHWWMKDLPFNDWINYQEDFESGAETTYSNHRRTTNQDPYASKLDSKKMNDGWFVSTMPDLNQRNPYMATYIIQNSIWWIETANLGGIRQDTYPYPDKKFMSDWAGAIMREYPNFSIVGEEWSSNPLLVAYWQNGKQNKDGYNSNLTSSMDFPMQGLIVEALKEEEKWGSGLIKIYEGLANDFAYEDPKSIMIFPDNHDMDRIFTQLDKDLTNTKMALSYLLVLPRIPQIYYGTEILMDNSDKPNDHGLIRSDFPGGWSGDEVNAFTGAGLSSDQKEMQSYLKSILNFRKNSAAIHHGKTIQYSPNKGIYVLFRISDDETVVHIINKNENPITLDLKPFSEIGLEGKKLKNVITNKEINWAESIDLDTKGSILLTTKIN